MIKIKKVSLGIPNLEAENLEIRLEYVVGSKNARLFWRALSLENEQVLYGTIEVNETDLKSFKISDKKIEELVLANLSLEKDVQV